MHYFEYRDESLYMHHSVDEVPNAADFPMHAHEELELYYFLSGNGSFLIEGNEYPLHPHDLLLMRRAEVHKLMIQPDEPYTRIAVHFPMDAFDSVDPERQLLRPFFDRSLGQGNLYSADQYPRARWHLALQELDYSESHQVHFHLLARIMEILAELCDAFDSGVQADDREQGLAGQLVAYVNEHLYEDISLKSVAEAFYRSTSQVGRVFRQATGTPLWDYVMLKRLMAARAHLQRGEAAGKTCALCGFDDYSSFYRAYKTRFGCAPASDLRRR